MEAASELHTALRTTGRFLRQIAVKIGDVAEVNASAADLAGGVFFDDTVLDAGLDAFFGGARPGFGELFLDTDLQVGRGVLLGWAVGACAGIFGRIAHGVSSSKNRVGGGAGIMRSGNFAGRVLPFGRGR